MRWTRVLPIFSIVFPIVYLPAMYFNWPVFTYAPRLHEFFLWRVIPTGRQAPGMFYYGWLFSAGVAALAVAFAGAYVEEKTGRRIPASLTWLVPLIVVAVFLYILREWFTH
jgi:hypothetical protein